MSRILGVVGVDIVVLQGNRSGGDIPGLKFFFFKCQMVVQQLNDNNLDINMTRVYSHL